MSVSAVKPTRGEAAALLDLRAFPSASPGETAILNAYFGGAGHEFVTLIEKEVKNLPAVIGGFESGAIKSYSVPGVAIKSPPNLQPGYTGLPHDALALNVGGAVYLKKKKIELAAIVRGPFTTYPGTTSIVFALDRGAGASLGPAFASRAGITPDALVTVTKTTVPISDPIKVAGPTVRILLPASLLPSKGRPIKAYQFAVWTETEPGVSISGVGSFLPEDSMVPIGVETNVSATF
jgi:hypothetical protein